MQENKLISFEEEIEDNERRKKTLIIINVYIITFCVCVIAASLYVYKMNYAYFWGGMLTYHLVRLFLLKK